MCSSLKAIVTCQKRRSLLPCHPTFGSAFELSPSSNFPASRRDIKVSLRHATTFLLHSTAQRTSAHYTANMPPKKAKAAARARAAKQASTRSNSTPAPPSVVTSRGKEYDTTAAAARPRRATAQTSTTPVEATQKSELTCRDAICQCTHH